MTSLRRRIEKSERVPRWIGGGLARYLAWCDRSTDWRVEGLEALRADLAEGPVLYLMWHERSLMGPFHWPHDTGPLLSLHDRSPIGRIGGEVQRHAGLVPMPMRRRGNAVAAGRDVLRAIRDGNSIGIAADGPKGPARQVRDAAVEWARVMQRPVYAYAFATSRCRTLGTWDRMVLPYPHGTGAVVYARVALDLPRKPDATTLERARAMLADGLTAACDRADAMMPKK